MSKELKEIVRKIQFVKDWTVEQVAESIDYSRVHLAREMKKEEKSDLEEKLMDKHKDVLQNVTIETPQSRHTRLRLELKGKHKLLPVNNGKAAAGSVTFYNDEPNLIMEFIDAPFIGPVEGVVEVTGDSMYPTLKNGARIAVTRLSDPTMIYWNEIYFVIDKNWQGVVKRIREGNSDDHIFLCSDNEKYGPVKRMWSQIEAVFKIKADITKH